MSRKSVPFPAPDGSARAGASAGPGPFVIDARSDEWVSDRNSGTGEPSAGFGLTLDLTADRGLMEVAALSALTPMALVWFWFLRAMTGRARL